MSKTRKMSHHAWYNRCIEPIGGCYISMTYKRTIYVNDQERIAYELAFTQGRYALCRVIDYDTYESEHTSLLTRFKKASWFSWGKIHNRYTVLTKKIIKEEIKR